MPEKTPELQKRSFLITGGAGFIGSCLAKKMIALGHRVCVLDNLTYAGHLENLQEIRDHRNFHFVHGNILNTLLVSEYLIQHQVNTVINCAAESHVDRSIQNPANFIDTNICGTFSLLSSCLNYWNRSAEPEDFRYVQISTDEVYGSLGKDGKFREDSPYAPNSPYSASKAGADHLVRAWHHTYGLPTISTHCSNNYGPYQFPEKLIPHMITCALQDKPLPVYGDGGNIRDWIHVEDHCHGVWLAIQKGKPGGTYCFGGNAERRNLDIVRIICEFLNQILPRHDGKDYASNIQFVKDRLGHDRRYAIDDSLAQNELGFRRKFSFEDGLLNTVQWYLNNQAWCKTVLTKKQQPIATEDSSQEATK